MNLFLQFAMCCSCNILSFFFFQITPRSSKRHNEFSYNSTPFTILLWRWDDAFFAFFFQPSQQQLNRLPLFHSQRNNSKMVFSTNGNMCTTCSLPFLFGWKFPVFIGILGILRKTQVKTRWHCVVDIYDDLHLRSGPHYTFQKLNNLHHDKAYTTYKTTKLNCDLTCY